MKINAQSAIMVTGTWIISTAIQDSCASTNANKEDILIILLWHAKHAWQVAKDVTMLRLATNVKKAWSCKKQEAWRPAKRPALQECMLTTQTLVKTALQDVTFALIIIHVSNAKPVTF